VPPTEGNTRVGQVQKLWRLYEDQGRPEPVGVYPGWDAHSFLLTAKAVISAIVQRRSMSTSWPSAPMGYLLGVSPRWRENPRGAPHYHHPGA
jgi:hypothetical protein